MKKEIVDYLRRKQPVRRFRAGEILFSQGDEASEFYYLVRGLSLTYTIFEDGRERNMLISWPDRIFGASTLFEGVPRRASAIAIQPCEVIVIGRELYESCCAAFPEFQELLIAEISKDIGVLFDELADASRIHSELRVARFLCRRLANGQHDGPEERPVLPFTQDFIGNVLGISRTSVNQAISMLAARGWLETSYGKIRLLDPEAVRTYAYG